MKDIIRLLIFVVGVGLGWMSNSYLITPEVRYLPSDTTVTTVVQYSWDYKPVIVKELRGEEKISSIDSTIQDSIHVIPFEVEEGVGSIEYNILSRVGELEWSANPTLRTNTNTQTEFTVNQVREYPTKPVVFHKPSFIGGCVTGGLIVIGLIYITAQVI